MTAQPPDLAEQLRRVVDALDRGDLTAGPLARAHLAGALDLLNYMTQADSRHDLPAGFFALAGAEPVHDP